MAKKNWRNSDTPGANSRANRSGWTGSTARRGLGVAGKAILLLICAGLLGGLFSFWLPRIFPESGTPLVFCDSYPASQGETILSSNAFAAEVKNQLFNETNADLDLTDGNLRTIDDVEVTAHGPDENVILFYVFGDLFVANEGEPYLLSHDRRAGQAWDGNAIQDSTNVELRGFLEKVCRLDVGPEPENGNQRIVVLDCGRLDATAFSSVAPEPIAESVESVIKILRDAKVPNSDRLWVLLATDDYQLGWTSPELNGSVFAYFFSQGLKGQADRDENKLVSLDELNTYVRESVARWVDNYRDAIQTPRLLCGGDPGNASKINLIHSQSEQPTPVPEIKANTLHDDLWHKAFAVPQPHRRQMACSRLVRLEQLRNCQPQEYTHVTNQVKTLLDQSKETFQFDLEQTSSVFDSFRGAALAEKNIAALKAYLKPERQKKRSKKPETTGVENKGPEDPEVASDLPDEAQQDEPANPKTISPELMHLDSFQRLALIWHFLVHKRSSDVAFGQQQLIESLNLIQEKDGAACEELVEMQFLVLLNDNLPWQENGFDESVFHSAIKCFDASQSLIQGSLTSYSDSIAQSPRPNDVWMNWRHVVHDFEKLETRRRFALDQAIAGQTQSSAQEFKILVEDYQNLSAELAAVVKARENANNLLFALPYLKSFALRDAIYRKHSQDETSEFCLPLAQVASLEKIASNMVLLLTGPIMSADERERLKQLDKESTEIAIPIRNSLSRIAIESGEFQTASRYVFEAQNLLMTPLPEWIDQSSEIASTTRKDILGQLSTRLREQQSKFFESDGSTDMVEAHDVDSTASEFRESTLRKLAEFNKALTQTAPVESLATGLEKNSTWSDVQLTVTNLPTIEQLKNSVNNGIVAIEDSLALTNEVLRLEEIDQKIRCAGPSIGLAKSVTDVYQQHVRLNQFDAQRRMLVGAIRDFWGAGDVKKITETPPPFIRRVDVHARNLQLISESMVDFRLEDNIYNAYDSQSLALIGKNLSARSDEIWKEFSRLPIAWQLNDTPVGKQPIVLDESDTPNRLAIAIDQLDATLDQPDFFPPNADSSQQLIGQRISLEKTSYYGPFEIPASSRVKSKARGTAYFRGHQFKNELGISRKIVEPVVKHTIEFKPKFVSNSESLIAVTNDVKNEVDLIFLFDCSDSMKTNGRLTTVKNTAKEIMMELAREKRFHIGLAAFGHRGNFAPAVDGVMPRGRDGKYLVQGHHPFDDWEILSRPPQDVSDQQYVSDLWDRQLSALKPRGLTPLYYSISQTLAYLTNPGRKNILVVVTDGKNYQETKTEAVPKDSNGMDKRPTKISDLENEFRDKYVGKVEVLVLQIDPAITQNDMPAAFTTVTLGPKTADDMKSKILDAVGRYQFSVLKKSETPTSDDLRPIGDTVTLKGVVPGTVYRIRTHGVPTLSEREFTLNGGETFHFFNTTEGLSLDRGDATKTIDDFLDPRMEKSIAFGTESYKVGRLRSNQSNNVRIGFANKGGMSQYPGRVWARIRDDKGREFDMTRPTKVFHRVPTYNFQMPDRLQAKFVNMTLFVRPDPTSGAPAPSDDDPVNTVIELSGEGSGEFRGMNYVIKQDDRSPTRFIVTFTSEQPISYAFHVDCPNSVPFGSDKTLVNRSITFEDDDRLQEVFKFEIPEGKPPTFRLFSQPRDKMEAALNDRPPAQDFKTGVDPIFGDQVIVIQFDGIKLRN